MIRRVLLSVGFALVFAGSSIAAPYTWTDTIDFDPDILIPPAHSYFHDISDGPDGFSSFFTGGDDSISGYSLTIELYDDQVGYKSYFGSLMPDNNEYAAIWTLGGVYSYDFTLSSETYDSNDWSLLGVLDIFHDGTFNVTVAPGLNWDWGDNDFYLAASALSVYGDNGGTVPVPEPGTILLLGVGLVGIALYQRKND